MCARKNVYTGAAVAGKLGIAVGLQVMTRHFENDHFRFRTFSFFFVILFRQDSGRWSQAVEGVGEDRIG